MTRRCNLDGQPLDPADQAVLDDFAAYLTDPTSRCPLCLGSDHTNPRYCAEIGQQP